MGGIELGPIALAAAPGSRRRWRSRGTARAACEAPNRSGEAGYAAVDALVALSIFASTIVFALAALHVADRGAAAALEARRAREVLSAALEQSAATGLVSATTGPRFTWRVDLGRPVTIGGTEAVCEEDAVATAQASGRTYRLASARICPAGPSS